MITFLLMVIIKNKKEKRAIKGGNNKRSIENEWNDYKQTDSKIK